MCQEESGRGQLPGQMTDITSVFVGLEVHGHERSDPGSPAICLVLDKLLSPSHNAKEGRLTRFHPKRQLDKWEG